MGTTDKAPIEHMTVSLAFATRIRRVVLQNNGWTPQLEESYQTILHVKVS